MTKAVLNTFRAFHGEKHPDKTRDFDEIYKEELNKFLVDFNFILIMMGKKKKKTKTEVTTRGQPF